MKGGLANDPRPGWVLGDKWRLESPLGGGAFGTVWRASDLEASSRAFAAKVLHREHGGNEKIVARFMQEAAIQAEMDHPAIVPVLSWGTEPLPFLVMPLVDGESLHDRCGARAAAQDPLPLEGVAWMVDQMCGGVAAAHAKGVVHRDLKPKNVLVNRKGQRPFVKVLDFGVAKVLQGGTTQPTTFGRVMGSILYLAPEQVETGNAPTPAVDQFALASIFFEVLTLRRAWARDADGLPLPFDIKVGSRGDNNQVTVLTRIVRGERPSVRRHRSDVGPEVDAVLTRALSPRPNDRFPDVLAFSDALRSALMDVPAEGAKSSKLSDSLVAAEMETVRSLPEGWRTGRRSGASASEVEAESETLPDPQAGSLARGGESAPSAFPEPKASGHGAEGEKRDAPPQPGGPAHQEEANSRTDGPPREAEEAGRGSPGQDPTGRESTDELEVTVEIEAPDPKLS